MASDKYKALLQQAWDMHVRKNAGYAGDDNADPWANFRLCEAFGITAFEGCLVRLSDKYSRVTSLTRLPSNEQVGESIRDTLMDLAAYAYIAVCLYDEAVEAADQDDDVEPYDFDAEFRKAKEGGAALCDHGVPVGIPGMTCLRCTLESWRGNNH